jgi:hypothetical protein
MTYCREMIHTNNAVRERVNVFLSNLPLGRGGSNVTYPVRGRVNPNPDGYDKDRSCVAVSQI